MTSKPLSCVGKPSTSRLKTSTSTKVLSPPTRQKRSSCASKLPRLRLVPPRGTAVRDDSDIGRSLPIRHIEFTDYEHGWWFPCHTGGAGRVGKGGFPS